MPASATQQRATLDKFFKALKAWKYQDFVPLLGKEFQQVTSPSTLGVAARERSQMEQMLPVFMATITNYNIKFHKVLHDPAENKACFHATSTGDTPFDDWNMEYVGFVTFSEDGTEVVKLEEFVDSSRMADFGPKLHEYLKGQKK